MKRRGAPGDPVSKLDRLIWWSDATRHGRATPERIVAARYQLEHGPPTGPDYAGRTWPTTEQMAELLEALEAAE